MCVCEHGRGKGAEAEDGSSAGAGNGATAEGRARAEMGWILLPPCPLWRLGWTHHVPLGGRASQFGEFCFRVYLLDKS